VPDGPPARSAETSLANAYREAAWKVQASARRCTDPNQAARLRSLAAWHLRQADDAEGTTARGGQPSRPGPH